MSVAPALVEYLPAPQAVHTSPEVAPGEPEYLPAAQSVLHSLTNTPTLDHVSNHSSCQAGHLQCALRLRTGGANTEFETWEIVKMSSNEKQHGSTGETNQATDELSAVPAEYLPALHWTHVSSLVAAAAVE